MRNLYDVLQVKTNASQEQIKRAYISLITKYHPDVYTGDKNFAARYTSLITEAYAILKDDRRRQEYDDSHNIRVRTTYTHRPPPHIDDYEYEGDIHKRKINPIKETSSMFRNTKRKEGSLLKRFFKSKVFIAIIVLAVIETTIAIFLYLS